MGLNAKDFSTFFGFCRLPIAYQKNCRQFTQQSQGSLGSFQKKISTIRLQSIQTVIGLDSRNDQPVEVTLIPKKSIDFVEMNQELTTFNAKKQLMLSSYFPKFLGYNTHADPQAFLYFSQYSENVNLKHLISSPACALTEQSLLFKHWLYLVYKSLADLFFMCSYMPILPISCKNYQVSNCGLTLQLKMIRFTEKREETDQQTQLYYESLLLESLGDMALEMLKTTEGELPIKVKKIQNRCLINCLLHARHGHANFHHNKVKSIANLFNIQTHPLFESKSFIDGQKLIQAYNLLLK